MIDLSSLRDHGALINLEDVRLYLSLACLFPYQIGIEMPYQSITPSAPLQCPLSSFLRRQRHPRRSTTSRLLVLPAIVTCSPPF